MDWCGSQRNETELFMTRCNRAMLVAACALLAVTPGPALAYTGPGLGMGALGVALGVIGSIFLGILAVIWYPLKRLWRALRRRGPKEETEQLPPE